MTTAPRVLLLGLGAPGPGAGGLERYFDALASRLAPDARGVVVGPAVAGAASGDVAVVSDAGAPLPARLVAYTRAARAAGPADVVDVHFPLYGAAPVLVGSRRRTPLVVHFHGPWAEEGRANGAGGRVRHAARRAVERRVLGRADAVVALSGAFARVLVERYRVSPWTVAVVPPGIDVAEVGERPDRDAARRRLAIADDAWVVACVRRLVPRTGVDVLVDAWIALAEDPRAQLVVAGDGPEREHLVARAARAGRAGIADRVRFLGRVSDAVLADVYAAADVTVVPSRAWEGFGLVVLESLAAGVPVIVSDEGGLPQAVEGLGHDLVVPHDDAAALAARLTTARDGTQPLPDAAACRRHARGFAWDRVVAEHRALYARVARRDRDPRLRVVYLDHCAQRSGGEIALVRTLGALDDVDAHVVLFEPGPIEVALGAIGVTAEVLPMGAAARALPRDRVRFGWDTARAVVDTARFTVRLARRIRLLRPDVVHANSTKAALVGTVAARLARRPLVWHQRELLTDPRTSTRVRRLVRAAAGRAAAVVANSDATLATLVEPGGRASRPTFVVPDGAPLAAPRPRGLVAGRTCFGVVGRLAPQKGQRELLVAFAREFAGDPTATVRIVGGPLFGEDDYAHELEELARALGIDAQVTFLGHRDDVAAELDHVDAVVVPSVVPEGFGLAALEAMGAGLPVIATTPGGPAELVTDGVDGLLVPTGDVAALARALRRLADDVGLRHRLGTAARARAAELTPERSAAALGAVYRHVAGRSR